MMQNRRMLGTLLFVGAESGWASGHRKSHRRLSCDGRAASNARASAASSRAHAQTAPHAPSETVGPVLSAPSAYIHLPFCKQRCHYCAFPVVVRGEQGRPSRVPSDHAYVDLLCTEISAARLLHDMRGDESATPLASVYLGGGTPSLTSTEAIEKLLSHLREAFGFAEDCEITCEMDPATFDRGKAREFRELGITRASVGAQTFDDELLRACGRVHRRRDIFEAINSLEAASFDSISMDLISGLPGQTKSSWDDDLDTMLALGLGHASVYDLTLEDGTRFASKYTAGVSPLPDEESAARMMRTTAHRMADAGFLHYEISNYARVPSLRSRHNLGYWKSRLFYGFGLGATSLTTMGSGCLTRYARPRSMRAYEDYVEKISHVLAAEPVSSDALSAAMYENGETYLVRDAVEDALVNGFRLLDEGVDLGALALEFGVDVASRLTAALEKSGLEDMSMVRTLHDPDGKVRMALTDEGSMFENMVVATLLSGAVWENEPTAFADTYVPSKRMCSFDFA